MGFVLPVAALLLLVGFPGFFPGWFDSAEFALAASSLGVSHPSGHPLWTLLAYAFTWLPFGSVAFRASFFSAVCLALALGVLYRSVRLLVGRDSPVLAVAACLAVLLHPSVVLQATRTEVYALSFLIGVLVLLLSLEWSDSRDPRYGFSLAVVLGLGISLQPVLAAPLILLAAVPLLTGTNRLSTAFGMVLFGALAFSAHLYLPLRASADPWLNWDAPSTFSRFLRALTAQDFQVFFHAPVGGRAARDLMRGDLFALLPIPLLTFSVIGLAAVVRRNTARGILMFLAVAAAAVPWLLKDFYLRNPDAHAYVMLVVAVLFLLCAVGILELLGFLRWSPRSASWPAAGLIFLTALPLLPTAVRSLGAHASEDAFALSGRLDSLPPSSEIRIQSDHWLFPLWYRQNVEGRRPDIALVGTGLLAPRWYRDQLQRRYGSRERSEILTELSGPDTPPAQAILQTGARFAEVCYGRFHESDPFGIRQSVCASALWNEARETALRLDRAKAIAFLESVFAMAPSGVPCPNPSPVLLPFPLAGDDQAGFLVPPDSLPERLALFYLECGANEQALRFLQNAPAAGSSVNVNLLRIFLEKQR